MKKQPIDYVNPFICTLGDHGHCYPGAVLPFGMIKLSPDTYPSSLTGNGDWAHSGYNYADEKIRGFSHLRIGGSGGTEVVDRAGYISVLPIIGKIEITPEKYAAAIDKPGEKASPGLYQVELSEHNIKVELTVTPHVGLHKYTFPDSEEAHILFDLRNWVGESSINVNAPHEIIGYYNRRGIQYFAAKFSKPFKSFATWNDDNLLENQSEQCGKYIGAIVNYTTDDEEVIYVKVGISTVSVEQARKNLAAEIPAWDFEGTRQKAKAGWGKVLNKIEVEGDEEYKEIFYTALYHSNLMPVTTTDIDGQYRGTDNQIHGAEGYTHYNSFSFWDTFRTKYPLLSLTEPGILQDIVKSIVDIYEQGLGYMPFPTVRHEHLLTVVLDAYMKGLRDFDVEKAYRGMRQEALAQLPEELAKIGYKPKRPDQTLEYAYDDWCVAQMAKALGKEADFQKFMKRAVFYHNIWDAQLGFFRSRAADGSWLEFPDPTVIDETYVYEATMWQWRWFVLHDIPGLIKLCGGREGFVEQLDNFFSNDLYNQGNQPDLQAPFLFNYAGAPWLTQKWVHKILAEPMVQKYGTHDFLPEPSAGRIFTNQPKGYLLEMDDDCGCMAAWYVLAAIGLFQVTPGLPVYQIVSPLFEKVTLKLDERFYPGSTFTIKANNLSDKNIYIQSAHLNGNEYNKPWIWHQDIVNGGTMVYEMGPVPNKSWGCNHRVAPF